MSPTGGSRGRPVTRHLGRHVRLVLGLSITLVGDLQIVLGLWRHLA